MGHQTTVERPVEILGVGLHSGESGRLRVEPAAAGTGRTFIREDRSPSAEIPVAPRSLAPDRRGRQTVLQDGDADVRTVEHLLAALYASGIDNVRLCITTREVPDAGDGSAVPFVEALERAGRVHYDAPRRSLTVRERVQVSDGDAWIRVEPADAFIVDCTYSHARVGVQRYACTVTRESFARDIAPARTFGFVEEVEHLRAEGLALGASLENALVIGPDGPLAGGWRFADECVRHKVLDAIGDFAVLGSDLRLRVTAHRAGHQLNGRAVEAVARCARMEDAG